MTAILAACLLMPPDRVCRDNLPVQVIRVVGYGENHVTIEFPNEHVRQVFWQVFLEEAWPPGLRGQPDDPEAFDRIYGPIIRGEVPGEFLARDCFFDVHAPKAAVRLLRMGILLETVIDESPEE
jgi:hypothetical protein